MQKQPLTPICPYCQQPSKLVDSAVVYGRSYGKIYYCDCVAGAAYVGCHKGTTRPLGRLADYKLRKWKQRAHAAFDPLWKEAANRNRSGQSLKAIHQLSRTAAYEWLAEQMGIDKSDCHIGMFDVEQCKQVCELCDAEQARISGTGQLWF